ncbi:helix-turn-helix transcriptional regulator [Caulobacter segnis]|uniref:hypothetical protein n=1 Tax=Caulobacter segnis TaxID=88688 RepID=UPI0012ECFFCD|nr:hypothetical protein [Caulobacter segnis]
MGLKTGKSSSSHAQESLSAKVYALIVELLPSGFCTEQEVAERLSINRRTLHRNLMSEATSYSGLLNRARFAMIEDWYSEPGITLTSLSARMGFKSLFALSRWRRNHEEHVWKKAFLGPDEFYWTDDDAYSFIIKLEPLPRRRKR